MAEVKTRSVELDILKGIGIFLMVFDHVGWGGAVHTYIQSFHMPLFFIVSGYLWKKREIKSLARARFKSLLVPYAVFSSVFVIIKCLLLKDLDLMVGLRAILFYPTDIDHMPFAPALWFLPCMFFSSIIYALLSHLLGTKKWMGIFALLIMGMPYSIMSEAMLPFCIEPIAVAIFFMFCGEMLKRNEDALNRLLDKVWVVALAIGIEMVLAFLNGSVDMRSARYSNPILYLVNGILGTVGFLGLSRLIAGTLPNLTSKILRGGGTAPAQLQY